MNQPGVRGGAHGEHRLPGLDQRLSCLRAQRREEAGDGRGVAVARRQAPGAGLELQHHPRQVAEQRVVQLAGDAGALRENCLEPRLSALRGQASAASLPGGRGKGRGRDECEGDEREEPPRLVPRRGDGEGQRCARRVPHAIIVGRDDVKPVTAGRQVGEERLASRAGVLPCGVKTLEAILESHPVGHGQAVGRVRHAERVGARREPYRVACRLPAEVALPSGRERAHLHRRRHRVAPHPVRVDPGDAPRGGEPDAAVRAGCGRGQRTDLLRRGLDAVAVIEALVPNLVPGLGERSANLRRRNPGDAVGAIEPELPIGRLDQARHAAQRLPGREHRDKEVATPVSLAWVECGHAGLASDPHAFAVHGDGEHASHVESLFRREQAD